MVVRLLLLINLECAFDCGWGNDQLDVVGYGRATLHFTLSNILYLLSKNGRRSGKFQDRNGAPHTIRVTERKEGGN